MFLTFWNLANRRRSKELSNGRCHGYDVYMQAHSVPFPQNGEGEMGVYCIIVSAWGLRCSFSYIGQCESLRTWDEWRYSFPRLFLSISENKLSHCQVWGNCRRTLILYDIQFIPVSLAFPAHLCRLLFPALPVHPFQRTEIWHSQQTAFSHFVCIISN